MNKQTIGYIFQQIDFDPYIGRFKDTKDMSKFEKIQTLKQIFESEKGWDIERRGLHGALTDWLQGLPSCLTVQFENHEIIEIGRQWGYCQTPAKEEKFLENWFPTIAYNLMQLFGEKEGSKYFR